MSLDNVDYKRNLNINYECKRKRMGVVESVVMELLWRRSPFAARVGAVSATRPPTAEALACFRDFHTG